MPEKVVYLDTDHTITAADIKSVGDAEYWADVLETRIRSIERRTNAPGYRITHKDKMALNFRKLALHQIRERKSFLARQNR